MDPHKIPGMRRAGQAAAATLYAAAALLRPGLVTAALDRFVRADTRARGGRPSQLGYHGFPASLCVSPNEVVCHGIPRETLILREGDIVNLDITTQLGGWHGDTSATFFVGSPSPEARHLVETARRCRDAGVAAAHQRAVTAHLLRSALLAVIPAVAAGLVLLALRRRK